MKVKITSLVSAFLFLFFIPPTTIAQNNSERAVIDALNTINVLTLLNRANAGPNLSYEGEMTLKSGESIDGYFSLNNQIGDNYVIVHYKDDNSKVYTVDNIDKIVLYKTDKASIDTTFKSVNDSKSLLREVFIKNDDVAVYDSATKPFSDKLFGDVYIKKNEELIATWFFWTSGPKHDLMRYIRNKDNVRYKRSEFKSLNDLFDKV